MNVSFDTNVLIYASDASAPEKRALAIQIIQEVASGGGFVAAQVLGELLSATHRKGPDAIEVAREIIDILYAKMVVVETNRDVRRSASLLAQAHNMQFFDALICTILAKEGVAILLSEDMQDGRVIDGLTILNPFNAANTGTIHAAIRA